MMTYSTPNTLPTQRLARLAVAWSHHRPPTVRDRQAAIRALRDSRGRGLGGLSLTAALEATERVAHYCKTQRDLRTRRARIRTGRPPGANRHRALAPDLSYRLPDGSPSQRLDALRRREIDEAVRSVLRRYARGDAPEVRWVASLSACAIDLDRANGWVEYSRRYGSRPGIVWAQYRVSAVPSIPVPRILGGLLTLGAEPAPDLERDNERVYRAVWARQAQDGPARDRGFIVGAMGPDGDWHYAHGATLAAARSTLTRRLGTPQRLDDQGWLRIERWRNAVLQKLAAGRLNGYDVSVCFADARRVGLCAPGIRAWCARHDIDPDGAARVSELLAVDDEREYVLAACVSAISRHHAKTA